MRSVDLECRHRNTDISTYLFTEIKVKCELSDFWVKRFNFIGSEKRIGLFFGGSLNLVILISQSNSSLYIPILRLAYLISPHGVKSGLFACVSHLWSLPQSVTYSDLSCYSTGAPE